MKQVRQKTIAKLVIANGIARVAIKPDKNQSAMIDKKQSLDFAGGTVSKEISRCEYQFGVTRG